MVYLLLHLLGLHPEKAGTLSSFAIELRGGIWLGWLLLAGAALSAASFWLYRRSAAHVERRRRLQLSTLRSLFLVLLLVLLARPVLRLTVVGTLRRTVLMLIDVSQSMGIPDLRTDEADIKRAAIAKDLIPASKGLDQPLDRAHAATVSQLARMEIIRSVLKNPRIDLIRRIGQDYSLQPFTFGDKLSAFGALDVHSDTAIIDFVESLNPTEPLTRIGDAVSDVLGLNRGQPVSALVLITDGQSNAGRSTLLAAEQAKREGVPLYIYGVGIASPRDIIVSNLFTRDVAFVDDELPVTVRVRNVGLAGETVRLVLSLDGKQVDAQNVMLDSSGEQEVPMRFTPAEKGQFTLKARIEPRADEASKDNNQTTEPLKVVDDKIKILYVERSPRWEFKDLMMLLSRDRRIDFKCLLIEGDPALAGLEHSPFVRQFPTAEELTKFDLVILGDVDPHSLTPQQQEDLEQWVEVGGGGLLSIAGRQFNPYAYAGTKLADLLPVDISDERGGQPVKPMDPYESETRPLHLELTPAGRDSPALRLTDDAQANADLWSQLPPIYWDARVFRAKPAATVLAVDTDPARQTGADKLPVLVLGQPGLGQVMYVGTDNTWRWRKNEGAKHYAELWGQIIQRLSLPHLLGGSKKTQISVDQQKYNVGDKVTMVARIYDDSLKPIDLPQVKAFYQAAGRDPAAFVLRPTGNQKGIYRGEFVAPAAGNYQAWVERDDKTRRDFSVVQSNVEMSETAMNEQALRQMAAVSGGKFFREEDLFKLPDELRNTTEHIQSTFEVELWSSWIFLSLLVAVVTVEWILRKWSLLK